MRHAVGVVLVLAALTTSGGCKTPSTVPPVAKDTALAERIERLVETFLMSDADADEAAALSEARVIFEREGILTLARVGDAASYGFVLVNTLGQAPAFRAQFVAGVREAASRHELPQDAVAFAEARLRQTAVEERYKTHAPSAPALRDEISRLLQEDQAVRRKDDFDLEKMEEVDRRIAGPLKAILDRYGVPTYEMVGVESAKDFLVMVQHQPPEFRQAVLPRLKANVDAGQADPGTYAMVYDRSQRDQARNQLYGEQLECSPGTGLREAPIDDEANVNMRRAELGLMRIELYVRLVRRNSPDLCGAASKKPKNVSTTRCDMDVNRYIVIPCPPPGMRSHTRQKARMSSGVPSDTRM
jgi:hypothetical protein